MGADSAIEWTDHTFNPWWGCQRVSPGCERCYAETFARRVGQDVWGPTSSRRRFGAKHWDEPERWNDRAAKRGVRERVFCASMADVFEDRRDLDDERAQLWRLIDDTPALDWLVLTKRPDVMVRLWPWPSSSPPPNVWAGTTVEDARRARERLPHLARVPAAVRFVSAEPLLGDIVDELGPFLGPDGVSWVITGGESGAHLHREAERRERGLVLLVDRAWMPSPSGEAWVRRVRDVVVDAGAALWHKQWGGPTPKSAGSVLDGRRWRQLPATPHEPMRDAA